MDNRFGLPAQDPTRLKIADVSPNQTAVSLWLYIAGLCVTLSGLYAVNFSLEDANFANLSYGLAIAGYVFSYTVRVRHVDLNSIKMPMLISVALLVLAYVSGSGTGWLIPVGIGDNHPLGLQVLFAWVAIIHTYMLLNDASVLFACVPGMTMLALVSTLSPEQEIQNAFLVFVTASTFLMVHENYLRTRNAKTLRRGAVSRPLFGGQLLLTASCLLGALILANLVAVPIKTVGQSLFDASMTPLGGDSVRQKQSVTLNVNVNEKTTLNLAQGPVTESDMQLLKIQAPRGMYWRGTTFSTYTGHSFENEEQSRDVVTLEGKPQGESPVIQLRQFSDAYNPGTFTSKLVYKLPQNAYDLLPTQMKDSHQEKQTVMVIGGNFSSLYGAATMREISTSIPSLSYNGANTVLGRVSAGTTYEVVSQVPTQDEDKLRKASSSLDAVPEAIRRIYLQVPTEHVEDTVRLKQLAQTVSRGKKNNYDKAEAIRQYISSECKYNLQVSPAPPNRDIIAWFLFDKKEGYCDSFAAAMTMMCRYAGMPARLVSGFLPGDIEADGVYVVREKHKHVWTEVFFPHFGWVHFDATEGTIDISDHRNNPKKSQINFVKWLTSHGSLPLALSVMLVVMLGYVVKTEVVDRLRIQRHALAEAPNRPPTNLQVIEAYAQTEMLMRRRGLPRMLHQTPDEYETSVRKRLEVTMPDVIQGFQELTTLYTCYRYGRGVATREEAESAQHLAVSIRDKVQAVKPREFAEMLKSV